MLAKAAAATPPIYFKNGPQYPTPYPFGNLNLQNRRTMKLTNGSNSSSSSRNVVVRARYSRRPLETRGAYEVIDDETGEKFIIWGGINDQDNEDQRFPIPSKEVLSWKPPSNKTRSEGVPSISSQENQLNKTHHGETITEAAHKTASSGGLSGSFGRLKAHRVRNLLSKPYSTKQDVNGEQIVKDAPVRGYMNTKSEIKNEQQRLLFAKKARNNVSRAMQLHETRDVVHKVVTTEDVDSLETAVKHGVQQMSTNQTMPTKSQDSERIAGPRVSVPRDSGSSYRKWGNGEPIQYSGPERIEITKKWRRPNAEKYFFSRTSFKDLGCSDYMIESLRSLLFLHPSHIQAMAFGPVNGGKSCIIADQSGSGKTLAYLLPVIQRLRQEELEGLGKSMSQNPRVVVLVPTAELASQVLSVCRSLSKVGVPFRSMVATGGFRQRTHLENLRQDLDVLISTPGRFMYLLKEGFLQLANLRCTVLDEVDILFNDEDFGPALQSLMNGSPLTTQYLFVTATFPVDIYNQLVEIFPDCEVIMGPGMHRTSPGLEEILVDCSGDDGTEKNPDTAFFNKKSALMQLVEASPVAKTIVFCNKIETCRKVENALKRFDKKGIHMRVLPFHAAVAQESRLENMEEFRSSKLKDMCLFLVCTDRVSRGIDFAGVDHVVLFDFPRDPSEYVRRVGRTARGAGGQGKAFIFVVGKQVSLAQRIIERNKKGHPLHDVPCAYERMI